MKKSFLLIFFILGCASINFHYGIGDKINNYPLEVTLKESKDLDFLHKGTEKELPHRDKKFINGKIRMVIPSRIGHVIVTEDIPFKIIQKVIQRSVS